eukprot:TRINITY_DN64394_c0_g1_i1.p1 TRINITY_DN64394_c0_g1~~TRINITY_DN64394_c0_g1_i1.p1  ORF type:complete len:237 (-),score=57.14 TRINITY_DN64394_c0_g1_i1:108-818(-)
MQSAASRAVLLAQVAERAERYDEMAEFMKDRVEALPTLSSEERDLLSAAYKGALNGRRHAVRVAFSIEQMQSDEATKTHAAAYRTKLEAELSQVCDKALAVLETLLSSNPEKGEPKAFYLKMQGDYYRYKAEFAPPDTAAAVAEQAREAYMAGMAEVTTHLLSTHPVRLGLALNYSVFQYELLKDANGAIATAESTLTEAKAEVVPEEAHEDAALTLQLLQENLILWTDARNQSAQ